MTCQWRAGVGSSFGVAGLCARKSGWRLIAATNLRAWRPATPKEARLTLAVKNIILVID